MHATPSHKKVVFSYLIDKYYNNAKKRFKQTHTNDFNKYEHIFDRFAKKLDSIKYNSFEQIKRNPVTQNPGYSRFKQKTKTNLKSNSKSKTQSQLVDHLYNKIKEHCKSPSSFKCNKELMGLLSSSRDTLFYLLGWMEHSSDNTVDLINSLNFQQLEYLKQTVDIWESIQQDWAMEAAMIISYHNLTKIQALSVTKIKNIPIDSNILDSLNPIIVKLLLVFKQNKINLSFIKEIITSQNNLRESIANQTKELHKSYESKTYGLDKSELELLASIDKSVLKKLYTIDPIDLKLLNANFDTFYNNIEKDNIDIMTLNVDMNIKEAIKNCKKMGFTKEDLEKLREMDKDSINRTVNALATYKQGLDKVKHDEDSKKKNQSESNVSNAKSNIYQLEENKHLSTAESQALIGNEKFKKLITQLNSSVNLDNLMKDAQFKEILMKLEQKGKVKLVTTFVDYMVIQNEKEIYNYYVKDLGMVDAAELKIIKETANNLDSYLTNMVKKAEIKDKMVDLDKLIESLCVIYLWKQSIYGNNPKILTFLNKIKNPDLRDIVESIEILKLLRDESNFSMLDDSINKVKSNKVVVIKDLVRDLLEVKKYRNTSKFVDLNKQIRSDIASVLKDNDLVNIMSDIKLDLQLYKTNDVFTLRRMKVVQELIAFHKIGTLINNNDKIKRTFCILNSKYKPYVDVKLDDYSIQNMLNSEKQEDFDKLLLISQIYNLSVNQIMPLLGTPQLFAGDNLKKTAMFYSKMKSLYPSVPEDLCNYRFKQVNDKKTQELINSLWNGIDQKCKDVNIKECQSLINTDASLNNHMSVFVNNHTQNEQFYVNHSDKDIHDINLKILNEIQLYLTEPNIDSAELKNRVYEISKLLPLHHPAHEAVDNALALLAKKEAEESKLKDKKGNSKEIDFTVLQTNKFTRLKNVNISDDEMARVPSIQELYKTVNTFKVVTEEGAVYSSEQVKSIVRSLYDNEAFNVNEAMALIPLEGEYDVFIEYLGKTASNISKNGTTST